MRRAAIAQRTRETARPSTLSNLPQGPPGGSCGELNFRFRQTCRRCGGRLLLDPTAKKPKPAEAEAPPREKAPSAPAPAGAATNSPSAAARPIRPGLSEDAVVAAKAAAEAAGETSSRCKKCGAAGHWARHCTAWVAKRLAPLDIAEQPERGAKRPKPPSDPSKAWEGTNAEGAAESNAALRARFAASPEALSEEERQRARQLLARDARKAERREQIRAVKSKVKAVFKPGKGGGKGGGGEGKGGGTGGGEKKPNGPVVLSTTRGHAPGETPRVSS